MKRALTALVAALAVACGSAAPAPVVGSPLTITQLKFAVMDSVGVPVYCDPDFYPIAREGGEQASAIAKYPAIQADSELYSAIIAHEHLSDTNVNDPEKLVIYRVFKHLNALTLTKSGDNYAFNVRVLSSNGAASYLIVTGTVRVDGVVTVSSRLPTGAPNCPICLAAGTLIATPAGNVQVTDIKPGMLVWTATAAGARIAAPVLEVGSTQVPAGHLMVHLVMADGRELLASPGHRTADGRALGSLAAGEALDGSTISRWELVPYSGDRTYDLLPAGPTGTYWANGIQLSSTLQGVAMGP
ncbi:MAG TPA: Hint domain-containing protein [Candidatus Dormibacteraeota bacterium]